MDAKLQPIFDAILDGDEDAVAAAVPVALEGGLDPAVVLNDGMMAAMAEVGRQFETGECFVPEMMIAAQAMRAGLAALKPHLQPGSIAKAGRVVIGTVKGDLHDIGKDLVAMMLEGAGFEVVDLGVDVRPDAFVAAVQTHQPDLVGMSALLTTTMPQVDVTLRALEAAGVRERVKVMIGGAAVTEHYAQSIGADGYAPDASRAVTLAKALRGSQTA